MVADGIEIGIVARIENEAGFEGAYGLPLGARTASTVVPRPAIAEGRSCS
jgi:hypothetical protein